MALFSHLMLVATNALIAALALSQLSDVSLENMFYIFYGHFFTLLFQAKFFDTHNYAIDTVMPLIAVTEASLVLVLAQLRLFHGKGMLTVYFSFRCCYSSSNCSASFSYFSLLRCTLILLMLTLSL